MASQNQQLITTIPDGKLCDFIDGIIRNDTPEEYVRQNIERRLVKELGYKPERIAVEFPIKVGSATKRVDIAIFPENAQHLQESIDIIIECKSEKVKPSDKKDGEGQLKSYLSSCPNAQWGMWTNGRHKSVFRRVEAEGRVLWEEPNDIPAHDGNIDDTDRPTRDRLMRSTDDNLLFSFRTCHDHIYITDGLPKDKAFFELLKVIFCKIHDERNIPNPLEFFATAKEKASNDGRLTVQKRIGKIFEEVKKRYPAIFAANDLITLKPRSLAYIVGETQRYSFLDTHIDVKGKAYEELVGSNLRGDRGEFFTPRNVQRMAIRMLSVKPGERILDPSCGTGGFLVIAMNEVIASLKKSMANNTTSEGLRQIINEKIRDIASRCFFGFDINRELVKATKMNMVMNNDGSGNILQADSLLHPHQWESEFREKLAKPLDLSPSMLRGPEEIGHFDVIATNPPFGGKLPISDRETLSQFKLAHVWKKQGGRWRMTDDLFGSRPPEILFIERCWQLLKPGGRMAIVLPDGILGNPDLEYVRYWLMVHCRIVASVDLHPDTFQPNNGTQTSVLLLQKKTEEEMLKEERQGQLYDYEIFMAQTQSIGHDKRGNTLYRRNEEGEEILFPTEGEETELFEFDAHGEPSRRVLQPVKRVDDDTPIVAQEFLEWKKTAVLGW
ncbi:MAG: N-6 DNA methylase [Desulfomicrobium sp.]|nr:N-6 DNA methylase [Pseudomonadota bacterium]MBV1710907.1 N-6 DNA methylase [Desulfomicrobium sp.]MBU4570561.1 N-6 DNA methylase [Pseudomonadota bacterium]MBU4593325.1 N-6 DNA methylase [Pseudomonadota bacterium]MBV1719361.1 N-6 DNA methylase [Desulfomicrobium sp.]